METGSGKKKNPVKQRRRRRLLCLLLIALIISFTYSIVNIRVKIYREKQTLRALDILVYDQKLLNEELERVVLSDGEKEYVERIAREKLGYAAIDERVFVDLSGS